MTTANDSGLDGRQIEKAEPVWIRQDVHLHDLAARTREADHGKHSPVRKARHDGHVTNERTRIRLSHRRAGFQQ